MTRQLLAALVCAWLACIVQAGFEIRDDAFWLDGHEIQILSGSLHYWRMPSRAYWRHRMQSLKAMGLNTIQTCAHAQKKL